MDKRLAIIISVVMHPLLMTTFLFLAIFLSAPALLVPINYTSTAMGWIMLMVFLTTFVIPMLSLASLKLTGTISNFTLYERRERVLPFLFVAVFYGVATYMFSTKLEISTIINLIFQLVTALVFAAALITAFWKISIHCIGIFGVLGALLALNMKFDEGILLIPIVISMLAAGATVGARLQLNAHSQGQAYAGAGLGLLVGVVTVFVFV